MVYIFLGVGGNIGDRLANIERGLKIVKQRIGRIIDSSCLYETVPAYTLGQTYTVDTPATTTDSPHCGNPHCGSPHCGSPHCGSPHCGSPQSVAKSNNSYLNLCVKVQLMPGCRNLECHLQQVLSELFEIEKALGRPPERTKNADRVIDLDILLVQIERDFELPVGSILYDQNFIRMEISKNSTCSICNQAALLFNCLEVPHPRMMERRFVLEPLADILPVYLDLDLRAVAKQLVLADGSEEDGRVLPPRLVHPWGKRDSQVWVSGPEGGPFDLLPVGILNLTPDSFSDGGKYYREDDEGTLERALAHVHKLKSQGAAAIDIGGESTWIKATEVSVETELKRIIPFFQRFFHTADLHLPVLLDTRRSDVLRTVSEVMPVMLNDVSGMTFDEKMLDTVEALGCTVVIMHSRGTPQAMSTLKQYKSISEVGTELNVRIQSALQNGIYRWRIIADPGIGFAKGLEQNLAVIERLQEWYREIPQGLPVCYGWSRKQFLDRLDWADEDEMESWQGRRDRQGVKLAARVDRNVCLCLVRLHTLKYWC